MANILILENYFWEVFVSRCDPHGRFTIVESSINPNHNPEAIHNLNPSPKQSNSCFISRSRDQNSSLPVKEAFLPYVMGVIRNQFFTASWSHQCSS